MPAAQIQEKTGQLSRMEPEMLNSPNEITWPNEILWQPTRMSSMYSFYSICCIWPPILQARTTEQICHSNSYLPPTTIDQQLIQLCKEAEEDIQAGMVPGRWRKVLLQTNSLPHSSAKVNMNFFGFKGKYGTKITLLKMHIALSALPISLIIFPLQH